MKTKISLFQIMSHFMLIAFSLCCIIPLILVLSVSLSTEMSIARDGYSIIPKEFSLEAYKYILFKSTSLYNAYAVTIFVTVVGTIVSIFLMAMIAYPLSRKDLKFRNGISFYLFFTMLFNGGLVPFYMLVSKYLHLKDTIWVLIIPYLISAWSVMLLRNFFSASIPSSIIEAAKIDGAGEFKTFLRVVLPMSKPALATVGLFATLTYWNDWWLSLLFIEDRKLMSLQYTLQSILMNIQVLISNMMQQLQGTNVSIKDIPSETARMALCVLAIGPIILAYPFFHKYLVKGMTVGSVKG